ncbi:filamentous hemagglutinin [Pseudomonas syringae]|uniref:hemagglutinin repeat-containing protein n=2 Tax=Pseudomonas syringae group TaxID=136849 RepID=UPI000895D653|nr:hemagglutinin repeat-containing protein [Pseudomonas syringae]SDX16654.1 filamentous hemagglutinin [Pseudomonas syringae]SFM33142.1 filamentous hemagglutinin [Pseudomonas syringae]
MNKHLYRIVFNKARGLLMVVAENVASQVKAPGTRASRTAVAPGCTATLGPLRFALMTAIGLVSLSVVPAWAAGIVADPSAAAGQRPTVIESANGTPQVNIQAPSAAGVSRNTYNQFDVDKRGVILNNSSANSQTQLGGWIEGNAAMAKGNARVILNEVNASNPSQLQGYVEVAGQRAQVVIANPAGITCDGCGFINANRATLSTGQAQLENGAITGYTVNSGAITIQGKGLDTRDADYTDLIARTVQVNAGIWANDLKVTAGRNQVNADNTQATPQAGAEGDKPAVAIDVAQLGGMYAGKIMLVGTESGVGMRNAGQIGAMAGEVVISADGKLQNQGAISSATATRINATSVDNSGSLYAKSDLNLTSSGDIDNSGTIASQNQTSISAKAIRSTKGSSLAAGAGEDGKLGSSGNLAVRATSVKAEGQNLAAGDLSIQADDLDLSGSQTQGRNVSLTANNGDANLSSSRVDASQTLTASATKTLRTDSASVNADNVQLNASDVSNVGGELVQTGVADTAINASATLDNRSGRIASNANNTRLRASRVDNSGGNIEHAGQGALDIQANRLDGNTGSIASNGALSIKAADVVVDDGLTQGRQITLDTTNLSNQRGRILQTGAQPLQINASQRFDNQSGQVSSPGTVALNVGTLNNQSGKVIATDGGLLTVTAGDLIDNSGGTLAASGTAQLNGARLENTQGTVSAGGELQAQFSQLNNIGGTLASTQRMAIIAGQFNNTNGVLGSVQSGLSINVTNGALTNTGGRLEAQGDIDVAAQGLDNRSGVISGQALDLNSNGNLADNSDGTLDARATLDLRSGELRNAAGLIQSTGKLVIDTGSQALNNLQSGTTKGISGQDAVDIRSASINNSAGFLSAKGNLSLNAGDVSNTDGGQIIGEKTVHIEGAQLDNRGGQLQSLGDVELVLGQTLNNQGGLVRSAGALSLSTDALDNSATQGSNQGLEGRSMNLAVNTLDNQSGAVRTDENLLLGVSQTLNNQNGLISSTGDLTISDRDTAQRRQSVNNLDGTLIAGKLLSLNAAYYSGTGRALSLGDLNFSLQSGLDLSGQIQANNNVDLNTAGALNNTGRLLAGNALQVNAQTLDNSANAEISAGQVRLNIADTLTNRGLIDGQQVRVQATTLNNLGTARLYGDQLAIATSTLNNLDENGVAATIAARESLNIGTGTLNNREESLIFSAGDLAIGGALSALDTAQDRAQLLTNASATVEALGNLSLNVQSVRNTNEHFSTRDVEVSRTPEQEFQLTGSTNRYQANEISLRNDEVNYLVTPEGQRDNWNRYDYTRVVNETQIATSAPAQILSGGTMQISAGDVLNDKSRIIAGGLLQADVTSLTNTELSGERTTVDSGTVTNFYRMQRKGRDRQGSNTAAYTPAPLIQEISLQPTVFAQNSVVSGTGTQISARDTQAVGQQIAATGTVSAPVARTFQVAPIVQVTAQTTQNAQGVAEQIRTGGPSLELPNNSLFTTNPQTTSNYLIETDPRFASYRTWLSSDYMLERLQVDPALTQQRLGDGFYEQKLIREQVAQLTGRRFLDGYANDEAQYRALIDNAVTLANQWQLVPGVELSPEQMAQLTSDIVWLVQKKVTLASGETRNVLVPQVYVRVQESDLNGSGSLIAGQRLNLNIAGDLVNSGSLAGRSVMAITAQNIENLGGRIQADKVSLTARENLDNLGGLIGATDSLAINAGQNVNVVSSSRDSSSAQGTRTNLSRVAGLFVSGAGGTMDVNAGKDLNLTGAQVVNAGTGGSTSLQAGNNINLATVGEAHQQSVNWNSSNWRKDASQTEVGSTVQGQGDVRLSAGQDLNARGASVTSQQGAIIADAGRDVNLTAAQNTQFADEAHKFKGKNGLFSSKTTTTRDTVNQTQAQGSTLSAEQTYVQAGRDINVSGSNVVSTNQTVLAADNNINIEAATESSSERHDKSVKKSGLFSGGGIAVTLGTQQQSVKDLTTSQTAAASTVGSTKGDVLIGAGKSYRQVGSEVTAPEGSVDITGQTIDVVEARNTSKRERETLFKQTGFTLTVTNPVISAIQTTQQMKQASEKTDDGRMKALAAATVLLGGNNAATAVAMNPDMAGGLNISLSLGTKKNESKTTQTSDSAAGSTITAGNDVRLRATGAGADSDITVQGSQIKAGRDASLMADGDINLLAANNTSQQNTDSKGSSASVGIGFSVGGTKTGFTLDLGVTGNKGQADGDELTHTNTTVEAGNQLLLASGGDTLIKGAVASGKKVIADVGGDLNIESLQDTNTYKVDEKSLGFGVSLCIPPFCTGMSTISGASGNFGATNIDSNFASVTEQSGIRAGDDGFDINVRGNTDLVGAMIASSDKAVQDGKNSLVTSSLTSRDIKNKADYDANTVSVGGGYNEIGKDQKGNVQTGGKATPGTDLAKNENQFGANMPIAISASDNASSVTRSGISGGAVVITNDAEQQKRTGQTAAQTVASLNRDVSSDRDGSNSLKPIFDEDEIRAGFEIVTAFSNEASTFLANKAREADLKRKQANALQEEADKTVGLTDTQRMNLQFSARQLSAEANNISENWGAGGTYRQITTALIGAAGGNISAGNAAFVQGLVVNYVQQRGAGYIGDLVAKGELTEGSPLHAALHGIVACAGAAASSQSCGSGAAGAAASSLLTGLFSQSSPDESEEQREAKRNLIVSLVTGLAATSASVDPTAANTAAGAAVDNNWLATQQEAQARKEYEAAEGLIAKAQVAGKWLAISGKQEILTRYGIGKGLAQSGWGDITGLAEFAMHPIDGLNGLSSLISDPEVRAQLGEEVANKFSARIDTIKNALEVGGDQNAVAMGEAMGELAWQIGTAVTGVGTAAKGVVGLAKAGIKVSSAELDKMADLARMEKLAKAEALRNRVVGAVADSQEASANSKFGQFAKTEAELRDAQRVNGAKGPEQVTPADAISPPKVSPVEDLFGQTFESIPLSHLPNWKTGSLVNDGKLGEQLALQTLNEKTGLNFKPLQNSSNHGCDGCAVAINGDTITVVVMDAKSSVNGVSKAGTPHGDPRTRLEGWLGNRSIADSDPALRDALQAALDSGKAKVQGVTVKVGVPAPSKTGVAEFKVEPWTKK